MLIWAEMNYIRQSDNCTWVGLFSHTASSKHRMDHLVCSWELGDTAPSHNDQGKVYDVAICLWEHRGANSYWFSPCRHKDINTTLKKHSKSTLYFSILCILFTALRLKTKKKCVKLWIKDAWQGSSSVTKCFKDIDLEAHGFVLKSRISSFHLH